MYYISALSDTPFKDLFFLKTPLQFQTSPFRVPLFSFSLSGCLVSLYLIYTHRQRVDGCHGFQRSEFNQVSPISPVLK